MPFLRLMINTGYMTIKEKLPPNPDKPNARSYMCNFTNIEVEELYAEIILSYLTGNEGTAFNEAVKNYAAVLVAALKAHDMPTAVNAINTMLSIIHYELWQGKDREALYRLLIAFFLQIEVTPYLVRQEVPNNIGRSDIEVLLGNELFVFELKLIHNKPGKKGQAQTEATPAPTEATPAIAEATPEPAPSEQDANSVQSTPYTNNIPVAADVAQNNLTQAEAYPISLATKLRVAQKASDQVIDKRYGSGIFSRTVEKRYGVVLVISEADRQICYWRHFTDNQDLGSGEVKPININNPPQKISPDQDAVPIA